MKHSGYGTAVKNKSVLFNKFGCMVRLKVQLWHTLMGFGGASATLSPRVSYLWLYLFLPIAAFLLYILEVRQ